ncbi:hypothetical protein AKJ09_08473 [Labilithrix luteola]|uniref:Uncharacterized protein n=1 Tax=Labilithrix luteola TaxID=1391654 RepID=A0A0K1Q8T2_9BACT|nr:tetratricopeptide repeat protein [Labilithrix luteola]AKV01810.1 hypothetical protein AKJ09_08473 [Labilithrix luteola]
MVVAGVFGAPFFYVPEARADAIADAEELFRRAKALIAQGKHEEACPLLKESYRLDPGQGTLLNLALCHEHTGRVASAWGEFRAVEQQARVSVPPRTERAELARQHAEKLEPRISRVRIVAPPDAKVPGLVVKIDGEERAELLWSGVPVDAGKRTVDVSAPGKKSKTFEITVEDGGSSQTVTLPRLEDTPSANPTPAPTLADTSTGTTTPSDPSSDRASDGSGRRTAGFIVGGIGVATLAAGAVFGVAAIVNNDKAQQCATPCSGAQADESNRATDRALVFANVANVAIPIGVVGTAIGAILVFTSGPSNKVALQPSVSSHSASLGFSGRW